MLRQLQMHIDGWISKKIDETDEAGAPKIKTRPVPDTDEQMQRRAQGEEPASTSCGMQNMNDHK